MAPVFDIRTLVLIHVAVNIGQALVMVYLWSVQRNYPPAKDWAIGSLMFAMGLFLFSLRNNVPVFVSENVSNFFLLPGLMIFNFGIVKAAGRRPPFYLGVNFCLLAIALLLWFTLVTPNPPARALIHNFVIIAFDLYVAYACLKAKAAKGNYTFKILGLLYTILVLVCSWRVAGGVFHLTFSFSETLPRLFWIMMSLTLFPMTTVLLTLHTSQRLQEEINEQARRDMLTGAFNRRAFEEFTDREWALSTRHGFPMSILMVDIDHFKKINDQHGHQVGDETLIQMSNAAQNVLRTNDIWCRIGGEEFVALLPNTSIEQAAIVAERIRSVVEGTSFSTAMGLLNVSVSIGVAERSPNQSHWKEFLATSDEALYKAKATGRNKVVSYAS
jgi:diguanylate cyclase (GGDEF)-like protein